MSRKINAFGQEIVFCHNPTNWKKSLTIFHQWLLAAVKKFIEGSHDGRRQRLAAAARHHNVEFGFVRSFRSLFIYSLPFAFRTGPGISVWALAGFFLRTFKSVLTSTTGQLCIPTLTIKNLSLNFFSNAIGVCMRSFLRLVTVFLCRVTGILSNILSNEVFRGDSIL